MKRFLADAALICLLVMLGSFMKDQQSADIGNQIEVFEKQVNMEINWEDTKENRVSFYDTQENKAGNLAWKTSDLVVKGVSVVIVSVTDFFTAIVV